MVASIEHSSVAVRSAGDKGLGLFAIQDIPKGTRILVEEPLIALPGGSGDSKDLHKQFENLTGSSLAKFRSLASADATVSDELRENIRNRLSETYSGEALKQRVAEEVKLRAIFNCNCVAMGTKSQWGIGVFELYSRINHSCTPNVHNSYNPELKREVVHASRNIVKDEELLTSYTENVRNGETRRETLTKYGFNCQCLTCCGPNAEVHETRRQRLSDIDQVLALASPSEWFSEMFGSLVPSDEDALQLATENISLLTAEDLCGMDLAVAYRDCARLCAKQGKFRDALHYAQLEREVEIYCLGPETEYMVGDDQYALTRIDEFRGLQSEAEASDPATLQRVDEEAQDQERKLSRSARRALARREAKAARANARHKRA